MCVCVCASVTTKAEQSHWKGKKKEFKEKVCEVSFLFCPSPALSRAKCGSEMTNGNVQSPSVREIPIGQTSDHSVSRGVRSVVLIRSVCDEFTIRAVVGPGEETVLSLIEPALSDSAATACG